MRIEGVGRHRGMLAAVVVGVTLLALAGGSASAEGHGHHRTARPLVREHAPQIHVRSLAASPLAADSLIQQGAKLIGTGVIGAGAAQGYEVALSADGNTALVGGPFDDDGAGAAWVFTRSGTTWTQQGKLVGFGEEGPAGFGTSVALSANGDTALVGGSDDADSLGAAWVFYRSGTSWLKQSKLVAADGDGQPSIGYSVALSADGDTALLGGPGDADLRGAAWVFTRSDGDWAQEGGKLTVPAATGESAVGYAVSLSADGMTALLGGPYDNAFVGAAWIFARTGGTWSQQGGKLTGGGETGQGFFGVSVSLAGDGGKALIGADADDDSVGAAFTFVRSGDTWSQQGAKITGGAATAGALFGFDVALAGDGASALVGALRDGDGVGAVWQFARDGTTWTQQGGKLTGSGEVGRGGFGTAVALSASGDTAVVGGASDDDNAGAAWVFVASAPAAPTQVAATAGLGQATVTFAASPGATSYTVTSSPGTVTATGPSSPIVVSGLAADTLYTFTVTASNVGGAGPPSSASNAVRTFGAPDAPESISATARDGAAEVVFDPPAEDGGTPVVYYTATAAPGGHSASGIGPITVAGLENGVTYTLTVTATNAVGTSDPSSPSNPVTPVGPSRQRPDPPSPVPRPEIPPFTAPAGPRVPPPHAGS